jgi:segregation and condensation protein B
MSEQDSSPFATHSVVENKSTFAGLSLSAALEALLFAAPGAVTSVQLAAALDITTGEVDNGLARLEAQFKERGLRLHFGRVQLTTAPEAAAVVEKFLGLEAGSHLSRAGLETLAIIAYQQPVTRPQIDSIRGVNSDGVLKSLLSKGLVQEVGRAERAGRPILYSTTTDFLGYFGLNSIEELPPLNPPDEGQQNGSSAEQSGEDLLKT